MKKSYDYNEIKFIEGFQSKKMQEQTIEDMDLLHELGFVYGGSTILFSMIHYKYPKVPNIALYIYNLEKVTGQKARIELAHFFTIIGEGNDLTQVLQEVMN